jgi:hypothetical protein
VDKVNLAGLDHVIVCTAADGKIYFRHYAIKLKKSGTPVRLALIYFIISSMLLHGAA